MSERVTLEKITALAKRRGFIYPSSEIYGGIKGFWDYGPLGTELKNNIKKEWWKNMVYQREDVIGVDAAVIMNPQVWEASGHLEVFTDPLVECKVCHKRFRRDMLDQSHTATPALICSDGKQHSASQLTEEKKFNLMTEA
ncbi:MAG: glycine--tRNA ligase, partial [Candidatus Paceibacterota bacterium]